MRSSPLHALDALSFNRYHALATLTTGMGVFTDGYDLASVGIVLPLILTSFGQAHLTGLQASLLTASALGGAALGALLFGWLAKGGRKRFYGVDVTIMAVFALLQAFAPNIASLIVIRFFLGIGIGADYVLSPMILAEHANARDRGKALALGFGLVWGVGATFSALFTMLLHSLGVPPDLIWRLVLAGGLIPAASVIYLRRKLPETPRFLSRIAGDQTALDEMAAKAGVAEAGAVRALPDTVAMKTYFARHWREFAAACLLWFLFDMVAYAGILFGPSVLSRKVGLEPSQFQLINFAVFTLAGAAVAVLLIDRWGRKPLQGLGFVGMAVMLGGFMAAQHSVALLGLVLYGLFTFFQQAGPGSVSASGGLGVELAPTRVRSVVQSLTVAAGRIGATLTAFVFPGLINTYGIDTALVFLALLSVIAAGVTWWAIPETAKRSLEESSRELAGQSEPPHSRPLAGEA